MGAAGDDLAHGAAGHHLVVVVDDTHLGVGGGAADRAPQLALPVLGGAEQGGDGGKLGHAVCLREGGLRQGGHGIISQAGRQTHVPSGTFTLYDSSLPYRIGITPAGGASAARALIVNFPRTPLPLPADKVERLTAVTGG